MKTKGSASESIEEENDQTVIFLEAILKNAAHALISTTVDGTITSFNPAAEKMLGYKSAELVGKANPGAFHEPEEVVQRSKDFSKSLGIEIEPGFQTFVCHNDLGHKNEFEWTYIRKDGTKLPVLLSITALIGKGGTKTGYLGIAQDISEIRDSERKLRQSNEELAQFAYRTSHDLKAPLVTIKGLAKFMKEDLKGKDYSEVEKNIDQISRHATRLEDLVVNILNLARADLEENSFQWVDLYEVSHDISESCADLFKQKGVSLRIDVPKGFQVFTQPTRLRQALENLFINGAKYSDPQKNERFVSITAESGVDLRILVRDNGVGIPQAKQANLFKLFTRFHPDLAEGSGLGMSIVQKNVQALGGKLSLVSQGDGTTIQIQLPKTEVAAA